TARAATQSAVVDNGDRPRSHRVELHCLREVAIRHDGVADLMPGFGVDDGDSTCRSTAEPITRHRAQDDPRLILAELRIAVWVPGDIDRVVEDGAGARIDDGDVGRPVHRCDLNGTTSVGVDDYVARRPTLHDGWIVVRGERREVDRVDAGHDCV